MCPREVHSILELRTLRAFGFPVRVPWPPAVHAPLAPRLPRSIPGFRAHPRRYTARASAPPTVTDANRGFGASLRRAARDVALIVLSILIAFWLDGWRDAQAERALLRQHLSALVNEFVETRQELSREVQSVRSSAEGTDAVLRMIADPANVDPDSVAGHILRSWSAGLFTARHPVLTSMLSSGELVDLRNDTLMVRLTRWQDRMGHLGTDSEHLERNREETIRDRLVQVGTYPGPFVDADGNVPRHFDFQVELFLGDAGVAVAHVARYERAVRLVSSYETAIRESDAIVRILEEEVERLGGR